MIQKIVFAGTPAFAATALEAILAAGFDVPLVLTQPDRPSGRGMRLRPSPVKEAALRHHIAIEQPLRLKDNTEATARIKATGCDVMVVAAYGLILPRTILDIPAAGCLNIHASLLPRWRGAAPIQRAIEAGDAQSGVCIMRMEEGLDTGPVLLREAVALDPEETAATLHDKLAASGAQLIVTALRSIDHLTAEPQAEAGVTYAAKIGKAEGAMDFSLPAIQLARKLRAFDPFPGCSTHVQGEPVKMWAGSASANPAGDATEPGTVLNVDSDGILVACGEGALLLTSVQRAGGKRLTVPAFLQQIRIVAGERFGA
jgi:methionyl-tRNA formyltransferase